MYCAQFHPRSARIKLRPADARVARRALINHTRLITLSPFSGAGEEQWRRVEGGHVVAYTHAHRALPVSSSLENIISARRAPPQLHDSVTGFARHVLVAADVAFPNFCRASSTPNARRFMRRRDVELFAVSRAVSTERSSHSLPPCNRDSRTTRGVNLHADCKFFERPPP